MAPRPAQAAAWPLAWCLIPFIILSTLNSGGYRYGASDLAFYVPAALERINPALFPRDAPLIAAQARLTGFDEVIAGLARITHAPLPAMLAVLYVLTLALLATALWFLGSRLYRSAWATAALIMALTLRHAVSRSGTNTLEGYFHPRQLAFSLGALALVGFLQPEPPRHRRAAAHGWAPPPDHGTLVRGLDRRCHRRRRQTELAAARRRRRDGGDRWRVVARCRATRRAAVGRWIPSGSRRSRPRTTSSRSPGRWTSGSSTLRTRR